MLAAHEPSITIIRALNSCVYNIIAEAILPVLLCYYVVLTLRPALREL